MNTRKCSLFAQVILAGILVGTLEGCSTVKTTEDRSSPIATYHRYNWLSQDDANRMNLKNPNIQFMAGQVKITQKQEIENQIKPLVDKELNKQGWVKTDQEVPDVFVTFYGKAKDGQWVSTWSGNTPSVNQVPIVIFPDFSRNRAQQFREGEVYITFYDAKTNKPAWTSSVLSQEYGPHLGEKEVALAINNMLSQLPKSS